MFKKYISWRVARLKLETRRAKRKRGE